MWALIQLNSGGNYLMHKYDKINEYWELIETTGGVQDDTDGHLIASKQASALKIYRIKNALLSYYIF